MLKTSKPVAKKTGSSELKIKQQKTSTTATTKKSSNGADKNTDKKTITKKSDIVGLSTKNSKVLAKSKNAQPSNKTSLASDKAGAINKKNVMNTIHNVTVASPPTSASKARSTSLINVREIDKTDESQRNHSRSRTRTIAPEESLLYQRNILSTSKSHDDGGISKIAHKNPVAYELNFDEAKKAKKSVVKSSQDENVKESSSVESQKSETKKKRKPLERQKSYYEPEPSRQQVENFLVPQTNSPDQNIEQEEEEENYESDFESYESDFEAELSDETSDNTTHSNDSEETEVQVEQIIKTDKIEKDRIDSGSFDMSMKKSATPSSTQYDSIDDTVNSHDSGISYDDANALNKRLMSPKAYDFYKRGEELMKKITFFNVSFDIFESAPIPYEVFMSIYGQRGMTQVSTQSESNTRNDECQTEIVIKSNSWAQYPAKFTNVGLEMINSKQYNEEKLGVGEEENFAFMSDEKDKINDSEELDMSISAINNFSNDGLMKISSNLSYDTVDINRFIQNAEITISNIIEGKSSKNRELIASKIPISRGYMQLKFDEFKILRDTIITKIYTNLCLYNFLISVHKSVRNYENLICLWNVLHITHPLKIFCAWSEIMCLEIHPDQCDFIIAGCNDGTICLWDIQEICEDNVLQPCEVISLNQIQNDFSLDNVIALKHLPNRQFKSMASMFKHSHAAQISSLHENGVISIWTLLQIESLDNDSVKRSEMDFTYSGSKVKLVKNLLIDLTKFTKMDNVDDKIVRKKSAFEKTRYYFENDLFSDKILRELQEIDSERLQKSKKISSRDDVHTISFDVNFNELFIASDSNFIFALSRLCLGNKAKKIITNELNCIVTSAMKVHPMNKNVLAIGHSNGSVIFIKTSDESLSNSSSKHRKQLKRSNAASSNDFMQKSCAFQNIVEREKKLYEETQALNNLESDELKAFMINEELSQQLMENDDYFRDKLKVVFDKNIFNSFDICGGSVKLIEFNKSGELMFTLINKNLKIFNCWKNVEIENEDNHKYVDVKCLQGSDGAEYLILLTPQNELLVNKLSY